MFEATDNPYLVPFDGSFQIHTAATTPLPEQKGKKRNKKLLRDVVAEISDLQRILYAHDKHAVLLVFQALDAAGKDSTIRAVMSGINPAGCQVFSFKAPSANELDHDFLWRTAVRLPQRGRIGVFNRSYYEEVLVVKVNPGFLDAQRLPDAVVSDEFWAQRYESIVDHERHLARNGTVILKFWLNVSPEEQAKRFLSRIDEADKNWKFSNMDLKVRGQWDEYMDAYQQALARTSRPWAPWYAIPADNKPYMRSRVAQIIRDALGSLALRYPEPDPETMSNIEHAREVLSSEG